MAEVVSDARARTLATYWQDETDPDAPLSILARTGAIVRATARALEHDLRLLDLAAGSEGHDVPDASRSQLQALLLYVVEHGERGPRTGWSGLRDDVLFTDPETVVGHAPTRPPEPAPPGDPESLPMPAPGTWQIDAQHSSVNFSARHLKLSNVRGRFDIFEGAVEVAEPVERSVIYVAIATRSIHTGVQQRDHHLRSADFLEVDRFPTMGFVSDAIERSGSDWSVRGRLTVRDVTRPVTLDVSYRGLVPDPTAGSERISFAAGTTIDRQDFGLTWNRPLETGQILIGNRIIIELDIVAACDTAHGTTSLQASGSV